MKEQISKKLISQLLQYNHKGWKRRTYKYSHLGILLKNENNIIDGVEYLQASGGCSFFPTISSSSWSKGIIRAIKSKEKIAGLVNMTYVQGSLYDDSTISPSFAQLTARSAWKHPSFIYIVVCMGSIRAYQRKGEGKGLSQTKLKWI